MIYAIRTGPSDFSQWLVTPRRKGGALPAHLVIHDGAAWEDLNRPIETPEEVDFFKALELSWIEPGKRVAGWRKTGMAR